MILADVFLPFISVVDDPRDAPKRFKNSRRGDAAPCCSSAVTDEKQIGFGFTAMKAVIFF